MPVFQLSEALLFPPPELAREDGLLAIGGDLSLARLLLAYRMGIFPWFNPCEPILWWAPHRRLILEPKSFRLSRRLARRIRTSGFLVSFDQCFAEVVYSCAAVREEKGERTWIDSRMLQAYTQLNEHGRAHSVECWDKGELVGGLYGISIGRAFFGESMFSRVPDSSKVALAALASRLAEWGFPFIDCQVHTEHLLRLGANEMPASQFYRLLKITVDAPGPAHTAWKQAAVAAQDFIATCDTV